LKKDETEPKGYYIYDTKEKKQEFIPIECRSFFYEELDLENANQAEVHSAVKEKIDEIRKQSQDALISLKVNGTLKTGLTGSDIRIPNYEHVYIDNRLDEQSLTKKLEQIRNLRTEKLSVRDLAIKELEEKTKDMTISEPAELFEKLIEGVDVTVEYLETKMEKKYGKTPTGP
jgi:hypothetical protein